MGKLTDLEAHLLKTMQCGRCLRDVNLAVEAGGDWSIIRVRRIARTLLGKEYVSFGMPAYWRITDAGRRALAEHEGKG